MADGPVGRITGQFVDRVLDLDVVPADAIEILEHVLLDGVAVMLAGSSEPLGVGRLVTRWVTEQGGSPDASVFAAGIKVPTIAAAFANGTMGHALDFDNYWHPRNHPMSPTVPALLALAEKYDLSGLQVLTSMLIAFEVQVRLRFACTGLDAGVGFHKPGMTGTMGSAAGCGHLLGLDHLQLAMAMGVAGSRAGSLAINTGTMTKSSHSGHAARMGLEAAELARRGWTASGAVFDQGGFFDTFLGERYDDTLLLRNFGDPFYIVEHGIGFKKYPCNGFTQRPIDATLELVRERDLHPDDVEHIEVDVPPFDYVNRPSPSSGLDAKFSIQYAISVALLDRAVMVDSFSDARRFSDDIDPMLERIELIYDETIPISAVETFVRLRVRLKDGTVLRSVTKDISGLVGIPLSREERLTKFYACTDRIMSRGQADEILDAVERFDQLTTIRPLMGLLCNPDGST